MTAWLRSSRFWAHVWTCLSARTSSCRRIRGPGEGPGDDRHNEDDATIIALKGVYALSKRTSVYALFTNVKNDDQVKLNVGQSADGKTARGFAIGLSHKF